MRKNSTRIFSLMRWYYDDREDYNHVDFASAWQIKIYPSRTSSQKYSAWPVRFSSKPPSISPRYSRPGICSLEDESLRVALFRLVDVLPSLDSSAEIGRHLEEYFSRVDHALGGLALLAQALHAGTLVAPVVRRNVVKLARRFIAEESGDHLIKAITGLRKEPAAFTLDAVGEATVSDHEAAAMQQRYLELLRRLAAVSERWH